MYGREVNVISEADVESLVMSSNDFIPSVIKAASALAARDKTISIVEYLTLFAVCEKIKKLVDNQVVVYVVVLKNADGSVCFEESLRNIFKLSSFFATRPAQAGRSRRGWPRRGGGRRRCGR